MQRMQIVEFTVGDLAGRLALCTNENADFHARQIRHWAASGLLDRVGNVPFRGEGRTAARVFTTRHLAASILLNFYANQRADIEFLSKVANLMKNATFDEHDKRIWDDFDGARRTRYSDGLATAIAFSRKIASGELPEQWKIYFRIHVTREGTPVAGSFVTDAERPALINSDWVEQRMIDVSLMLPCIFIRQEIGSIALTSIPISRHGEAHVAIAGDDPTFTAPTSA